MDIVSLAVTVLAIYGMLQRSPELATGAAREWSAIKDGEESPTALERRERLIEAGIEPVTDGAPMRQYLGNAWRDMWNDLDNKRRAGRLNRLADQADAEARSWRDRLADQVDDEVGRRAGRYRTAPQQGRGPQDPPPGPAGGSTPADLKPPPGPAGGDAGPGGPTVTVVHNGDEYVPGSHQTAAENREPIRVSVQVGDPITEPKPAPPVPQITAGGTVSIVQTVTGVSSGAAEARAIRRQIDAATEAYVAHLNQLRRRIHALGEQTLNNVQLSTRSRVIHYTADAAEAAAQAQATAKACSDEVGPLLDSVAREFNRINS